MNPKERIIAALKRQVPDEVPVSLSIGPTNAQRWTGKSDWRAVFQAHQMVGSIPEYGFPWYATTESNPIFVPHWKRGWDEQVHTETIRDDHEYVLKTRQITTPMGNLTSRERIDYPEYVMGQTLEPLIKKREDYEIYLAYIEEWLRVIDTSELSQELQAMQAEIGDQGIWVTWRTHSFYSFFWVLRRVADYLLDFYDAPQLMQQVLEVTRKVNSEFLAYFNNSPSDIFIVNLSGASSSIISPAFFRQWVLPELFWLAENIQPGKFLGFHLTGKVRDILPVMLEVKPDFVLRFESPRFGGDISLAEAKKKYGDQICLMGGYDPHFFSEYSLDEMCAEARRCIDEAAQGGGYILATTDAIPEQARLEDIRRVVQVAREYGSYAASKPGGSG
jgi:hypothetical protein